MLTIPLKSKLNITETGLIMFKSERRRRPLEKEKKSLSLQKYVQQDSQVYVVVFSMFYSAVTLAQK